MEITKAIQDSIETKRKILESDKILSLIKQSADLCIETFKENGKVLLCCLAIYR